MPAKTVTPEHKEDKAPNHSELQKREILRLNNEEAKKVSRECFKMALIYLMNEKPFDRITVTDLVKRSGVSRTAFYRHYSTKEDILSDIGNDVEFKITQILEKPEHVSNPYQSYLECFRVIQQNKETISLMLGAGFTLDSLFRGGSILEKIYPSNTIQKRYVKMAAEAAFIRIVLEWFNHGMKEPLKDMAQLCDHLFSGIRSLIL